MKENVLQSIKKILRTIASHREFIDLRIGSLIIILAIAELMCRITYSKYLKLIVIFSLALVQHRKKNLYPL